MNRSRNTRARAFAFALAAMCVLVGTSAVGASAGEYHVYSCRTPDGQVAPVDGWSSSKTGVSDYVEDGCAEGKALMAALGDGTTHEVSTDVADWTFGAPAEETIVGASLWRAGDVDGGWATNATYEFWIAGPNDMDNQSNVIDQCVAEFGCPTGAGSQGDARSPTNSVTVLPEYLDTHLYVNVSCGGSAEARCPSGKGDGNGYAAVVYLYAADLVLEQTAQPTFSDVEGELATASTLSGTADLSFHAEDPGAGVYEAVFTVDGTEAGHTLLDEDGGRCKQVGQATDGLPDFLYVQPCKPSLSADIPFDTTALADGTHHLVVSVTDAAGNSTVVLDRKVAVSNHAQLPDPQQGSSESQSPPQSQSSQPNDPMTTTIGTPVSAPADQAPPMLSVNGQNASADARLTVGWSTTAKAALASGYGRTRTVDGKLTAPNGAPIAGAQIQVLYTPAYEGAHALALPSARTRADGNFSLRLPASIPSSRLTFAYSSHVGQPTPDVTAALSLTVAAGLRLNVAPRVSHAGGTIVFDGALHGIPIPPGGKQIVLEARTPGASWRQFKVLATIHDGHYRASYRFRLAGPVSYQFRAVSPKEADFPFAAGASNVVTVRER